MNLDISAPKNSEHSKLYRRCDILDLAALTTAMESFRPSAVVHLAARTDLEEDAGLQGYAANIEGVRNLLQVVARTPSIKRVLFASSKLVNKNGQQAGSVSEYAPDTVYGMSKALGEQLVEREPTQLRMGHPEADVDLGPMVRCAILWFFSLVVAWNLLSHRGLGPS